MQKRILNFNILAGIKVQDCRANEFQTQGSRFKIRGIPENLKPWNRPKVELQYLETCNWLDPGFTIQGFGRSWKPEILDPAKALKFSTGIWIFSFSRETWNLK